VKIVNKPKKSNGVRFALCLAACMAFSRAASAEVVLTEQDGWTFSFDGRVNGFMSGGFGDNLPLPTGAGTHTVMGTEPDAIDSVPDVGWHVNFGQADPNNKFTNIRVRSGFYGNILGFAVTKRLGESTTVRGYVSIWSTIESLGEDKWAPINPVAREGFLTVTGNWGAVSVGRMLGYLGRLSYEIDSAYGHGFGVGLPCTDSLGPACGHIGTGELFPGYGAGVVYNTPSLGGLKLHVGIYDPIIFSAASDDWSRASLPRPEGALYFDRRLGGAARIKVGAEGMVQQLSRTCPNAAGEPATCKGTVWGAAGGLLLAVGPLRVGLSGFTGKGLGLFYALQKTHATEDRTHEFRTFTGFYSQTGLEFGRLLITGGFGMSLVNQTNDDKLNIPDSTIQGSGLSVIRYHRGISGGVYFHAADNIVLGLDYFNFAAGWWGAPLGGGNKLAGEKQIVNFVNGGVTYYW
jgi:hypothetical protein